MTLLSQSRNFPAVFDNGGDDVKEGPAEIYARAKVTFFKSLMDGIGRTDAAADYHYALLNLQRHDGIIPFDNLDATLQKMVAPVLKQGGEYLEPSPWLELPEGYGGGPISTESQIRSGPEEPPLGPAPSTIGQVGEAGRQYEVEAIGAKKYPAFIPGSFTYGGKTPMYGGGAFGINPKGAFGGWHNYLDRTIRPESDDAVGRTWVNMYAPQAVGREAEAGYEYENPMRDFHPLHGDYDYDNPIEGTLPPWVEMLRDFYLPKKYGEPSRAELDKPKEAAWEDHHRSHPDFGGGKHSVLKSNALGELGDGFHNHDLYEIAFDNWKADPDLRIGKDRLTLSQFYSRTNPAYAEGELRQAHMRDAEKGWLSDEVIQEGDRDHAVGMGDMDYHLGLEWLTPQQRTAVYDHLHEHGSDNHIHQKIKNVGYLPIGRLKRNFYQRFAPQYEWFGRDADITGPNIEHIPEKISDIKTDPQHIRAALHGDEYAALLNHYNDLTREGGTPRATVLPSLVTGGFKERDESQGKTAHKWLHENALKSLAGIDRQTGEYYPANEHPYLPNWDPNNAPLSIEQVDNIISKAGVIAGDAYNNRRLRNANAMHTAQHVDAEHHPYSGGENTSLSHHWGTPYRHVGGLGKDHNILIDILHDSLAAPPEEGREHSSLLGTKQPARAAEIEGMLDLDREGVEHPLYGEKDVSSRIRLDTHLNTEGMFAPFLPRSEIQTPHEVIYAGGDPHKDAKAWGKKYGTHGAVGEPAGIRVNHHDSHFQSGTKGGNSDFRTHATSMNGPASNKMSKDYYKNYSDRGNRGPQERAMIQGNFGGNDTSYQFRTPMAGQYKIFGESREDNFRQMYPHKMMTQLNMLNSPMNPQSMVPYNALHREHEHSTDSPEELQRLMRIRGGETLGGDPKNPRGGFRESLSPRTHSPISEAQRPSAERQERERHTGPFQSVNDLESMEQKANIVNLKLSQAMDKLRQARLTGSPDIPILENELGKLRGALGEIERNIRFHTEGPHDAPKPRTFRNAPLETSDEKYFADLKAIGKETARLRKQAEDEGHAVIIPGDPETSMHNLMNLARIANTSLNRNSHDVHGAVSKGVAEISQERKIRGGGEEHHQVKQLVHSGGELLSVNDENEKFYSALGMDEDDFHHNEMLKHLKGRLRELGREAGDEGKAFNVMGVHQLLGQQLEYDKKAWLANGGNSADESKDVSRLYNQIGRDPALQNALGLHWTNGYNRDEDRHVGKGPHSPVEKSDKHRKRTAGRKHEVNYHNHMQKAESMLIADPDKGHEGVGSVEDTGYHITHVPIGNAGSPEGNAIHSIYDSHGHRMNAGHKVYPTLHPRIGHDGRVKFHTVEGGKATKLITLDKGIVEHAGQELMEHLDPHHQVPLDHMPAWIRTNSYMETPRNSERHNIRTSDGPTLLASLTNPDILLKIDSDKPPPLQPMHRIFEIEDLEELKGFTGDWVVSLMPEGERVFIKRDDDEVTAWSATSGDSVKLSGKEEESLKKMTENNFLLDTIKTEDEYHVFDILEFDDKDVHDESSQDRMKILRGGMESHENILLPAAYNTRLTDDAGLELAVSDLEKEGERILLRDAKSTYMAGEKRHPKWVLLSPGQDVNLVVLEKRGAGPYSYRLGTGPITQADKIGDRAVEVDGEHYMDVGTVFHSDENYDEGDHVKVNVDSATSHEVEGEKIFTIHAGSIKGEAEGEALASMDTLGILTKCEIWPHEVGRRGSRISISFSQGTVIYKATCRGQRWMVHSPQSESNLLIRMAESQRPFWSPIVGTILKGDYDIVSDKEKKEEVKESNEDAKPLIPPKKVKGTGHWDKMVEALKAIEKTATSWSGAKGLGFDYGTPIESPHGPTSNRDHSTMPDYDNRKRPGEDIEKPYDKKGKRPEQIDIPIETEKEVGSLHVDSESAVIHG